MLPFPMWSQANIGEGDPEALFITERMHEILSREAQHNTASMEGRFVFYLLEFKPLHEQEKRSLRKALNKLSWPKKGREALLFTTKTLSCLSPLGSKNR